MTPSAKSKSVEIDPIKYNGSVVNFRAWMDTFLSRGGLVMLQPSISQEEITKRAFSDQKGGDILNFTDYYPRLITRYSEIDQSPSREVWYVTKFDPITDEKIKPLKRWATILAVETFGQTTVDFLDGIYFRLREPNGLVTDYAHANFIGDDFSNYANYIKGEWQKNYSQTELNTQEQVEVNSVPKVEKTVFMSYRRKDISWALAVYQYLTNHGYDVFFDFTSIPSGDFEQIIISSIKSRAHFLVILTPSALDRCTESEDWFRREIETALEEKRNIIPVFCDGFSFEVPSVSKNLFGQLVTLKKYNGLEVPASYFEAAMERLRNQYLNVSLDGVLHPVSEKVQKVTEAQKTAANNALLRQKEEGFTESSKVELISKDGIPAIQEFMIRSGDFFGRPKRIRQAAATEIEKLSVKLQLSELLEFANSNNSGERVACGIALREKLKLTPSLSEDSRVQDSLGKLLIDPESFVRYRALRAVSINNTLVTFFMDDM